MIINGVSLILGLRLSTQIKRARIAAKFVTPFVIIYELLNAAAIILNIFGRVSLAKIYSLAAIIGLTQIIGLAVFIQVFSDALELQIKVSACTQGLFSRISVNKTRVSFRRALSVISVILWLLVFLINLSVAGGVFEFIHQVLVKRHSLGSITFTLGNVLFFGVILYISNLLQKHIGIVFGERSVTFSDHVEHKGSKLTLLRLLIAVIGILVAVTASGIPLDKLTVVLGALSVGIGLGMQNIVNNFVSGIILIFEKPFQIGDFVELADKKGKIQDIGIRASKMLTQQGSEVIIPNGDLISNRFTNWTINSAWVQSEIIFKVAMASDLKVVYKMIDEAILGSKNVIQQRDKEIFINSISADAVELRLLVWIESIYVEPDFKSQFFGQLIEKFNKAEIKLV
jgi:small-conductance mechanosensitive channel